LQYKQRYTDKDTQDFIAMAALQYVTKVLELEQKTDISPLEVELNEINQELDEYLKRE
jgi:cell division protein ZapA